MSRAIGGYVRRCERKPAGPSGPLLRPWARPFPYPEPPTWQCMPILRFEKFDVTEPIDTPIPEGLRSSHDQRTK